MKRVDASKLQDEYEKLVAGLQQANERREDEDMLASPGQLAEVVLGYQLIISVIQGHAGRSHAWKHPKGRALHCILEKVHRIHEDKNESPARRGRNASVVLGASEGDHFHREAATEVSSTAIPSDHTDEADLQPSD